MKRVARWCFTHRRSVLLAWLVLAVVATLLNASVGSNYNNSFTLKGSEAADAVSLLQESAPRASGSTSQIVVATRTGRVTDPQVRQRFAATLARVSRLPHVGTVVSPYGPGVKQIAKDGTVAFATLTFDELADKLPVAAIRRVVAVARTAASPAVQVELGGDAIERVDQVSAGGLPVGLALAAIVLFIAFGSLAATALPLLAAGFALASGVAVTGLLSNVITMPDFSTQLALLLGLGVGVDYALFIVTRYRQALMRGLSSEDSAVQAIDTSGRAVLFAGMTVCIALLGMLALGVSLLGGVGIAASIVVGFTVLAALTLTPAMLGFFGRRTLTRRARRALAAGELSAGDESPAWRRWAELLRARPALMAALATGLMLLIAVPFLSLREGSTDAGSDPSSTTTRKAYDLLAKGFGPGSNGPLELVARIGGPGQRQQFDQVVQTVGHLEGVQGTTPPVVVGGGVAVAQVVPVGSPQDASTSALVSSLRNDVLPRASDGKLHVLVGGQTALFDDFDAILSNKLPLFIGVVVLLSCFLLLAVFRSLLIPLVGAAMNLLSAGAAFGVVTAVFQWGWLAGLIGVSRTGPIDAFAPVIIFAILFGLSMDYQVFLVSRIYESWQATHDNAKAVTHGLAATGRTITTAAAIMVLVFAAFVLGGEHVIKLFGVGLASAVLLDALVVRSILTPSLMLIIGKRQWSLPTGLDRVLPQLKVEGDVVRA